MGSLAVSLGLVKGSRLSRGPRLFEMVLGNDRTLEFCGVKCCVGNLWISRRKRLVPTRRGKR